MIEMEPQEDGTLSMTHEDRRILSEIAPKVYAAIWKHNTRIILSATLHRPEETS